MNQPKPLLPGDERHGSYAGYLAGCRKREDCEASPTTCVDAERAYQLWRNKQIAYGRPLKVPATGTKRRIQAMLCQGWPGHWIAAMVNTNRAVISCNYPTVRTKLAVAIRELYEEYQHREGPSNVTRGWAVALGYIPPWRWEGVDIDDPDSEPNPEETEIIDQVAIDRRLDGDRSVKLTKPEMVLACHQAQDRKIERPNQVLGVSGSTYANYLKKERPDAHAAGSAGQDRVSSGHAGGC